MDEYYKTCRRLQEEELRADRSTGVEAEFNYEQSVNAQFLSQTLREYVRSHIPVPKLRTMQCYAERSPYGNNQDAGRSRLTLMLLHKLLDSCNLERFT